MWKLFPSKKQWGNWSMLSKATYISVVAGVLSIFIAIIFFIIQTHTGATKENQVITNNKLDKLSIMVEDIGKARNKELMAQFPEGFTVFGILKPSEPLIKGFVHENLKIDWDTGRIAKLTTTEIYITLPNMTIKRGNMTMNLNQCGARLKRQIGIIQKVGFSLGDLSLSAEVLSDKDIPVVVIGFNRTEE
jgi:hypothetical protein